MQDCLLSRQPVRNLEAERLRGHQIDDEIELSRLLNWQVRGFDTKVDASAATDSLDRGIGRLWLQHIKAHGPTRSG